MNQLSCVFYTVLSMSCMMLYLFPFFLLLRFLMRNMQKRWMRWEWKLFYLKAICPLGLTSPICMIPAWNRQFHLLLSQLGLRMESKNGLMNSWRAVFTEQITVNREFMLCSLIWLAGTAAMLFFFSMRHRALKNTLMDAKEIGENIYQSDKIKVPVVMGIVHRDLYIPDGITVAEVKWLLQHMQYHRRDPLQRVIIGIITSIHWFNPVMWLLQYMWAKDVEADCDERTAFGKSSEERLQYAQKVLNFQKGKMLSVFSIFTTHEINCENRAQVLLYQKRDKKKKLFRGMLLLVLTAVFLFLLSFFQLLWNGTRVHSQKKVTEEESLFKQGEVIASAKTTSSTGLEYSIQLVLDAGQKTGEYYDGSFRIKLCDSVENEVDSCDMKELFSDMGLQTFRFPKKLQLRIDDYNGDGIQELVLGQKIALTPAEWKGMAAVTTTESAVTATEGAVTTDKKLSKDEQKDVSEKEIPSVEDYDTYVYSIVNLEDSAMKVLCQNVYASAKPGVLQESVMLNKIPEITDIFTVEMAGNTNYYVWNQEEGKYTKKILSAADVQKHKNVPNDMVETSETKEHVLKNDAGDVLIKVNTQKDDTGSEEIKSVVFSPKKKQKKLENLQGYFCDIKWVDTPEKKKRYAVLYYNGTKTQTFVVYDVVGKEVYYSQEDGSNMLNALFKQYRNEQIQIEKDTAVIYRLEKKEKDILQISFATTTNQNVAIKGGFEFDVKHKRSKNLSYSQDSTQNAEN